MVAACATALERLSGKTVLITGATGFLGGSIVDALVAFNSKAATPCELLLATRSAESARMQRPDLGVGCGVRWLEWPLPQQGGTCEFVIHAAAPLEAGLSGEAAAAQQMVELAAEVVAWAKRHGAQSLLLLSSGAVYGTPVGPYGEAKRRSEALFADSGVPATAARLFACFGPRQPLDARFAIPSFFRQASQDGKIRVASDGKAQRTFAYVSDVVCVLLNLVSRSSATPDVCDVGGDLPVVSIAETAHLVAEAWGGTEVVIEGSKADTVRPRYVPDVSLMKKVHVPQVSLEEGLRRTAQSIRARASAGHALAASRA